MVQVSGTEDRVSIWNLHLLHPFHQEKQVFLRKHVVESVICADDVVQIRIIDGRVYAAPVFRQVIGCLAMHADRADRGGYICPDSSLAVIPGLNLDKGRSEGGVDICFQM